MQTAINSFLGRFSLEITPRQADKLPQIAARVPKGTATYIALVDPADVDSQYQAAKTARAVGLEPVPHVPARFITDAADLEHRIARLAGDAGVRQLLVLGGGASEPLGDFDASIQLFRAGAFERHGIVRVGIAGHPEGNADITRRHGEAALVTALMEKQAFIKAHGLSGYIATQFVFEAEPVATWAAGLREAGIDLPIHVGVPGPATIKTLVKYATVCGVGNSARFIRKQALNVAKLLTVSTPDQLVTDLAVLRVARPALDIAAPHFYPFGGFDRLFDWLAAKLTTGEGEMGARVASFRRQAL